MLRLLNEADMSSNPVQASLRDVSKSAGVERAQRRSSLNKNIAK